MKKNKFLLLLLFITSILNYPQNQKKDLHEYITNFASDKKALFYQIHLIKKCDDKRLFSISKMYMNDNLNGKYKYYEINDVKILYDITNIKDTKSSDFFNIYFCASTIDITKFPKGSQSIIEGIPIYFDGKIFVKDFKRKKDFMDKDCK